MRNDQIIFVVIDKIWHLQSVCSEDETVLMKLQDVMEYLDSKENLTMDMVLTRISKSLTDVSFFFLLAYFSFNKQGR